MHSLAQKPTRFLRAVLIVIKHLDESRISHCFFIPLCQVDGFIKIGLFECEKKFNYHTIVIGISSICSKTRWTRTREQRKNLKRFEENATLNCSTGLILKFTHALSHFFHPGYRTGLDDELQVYVNFKIISTTPSFFSSLCYCWLGNSTVYSIFVNYFSVGNSITFQAYPQRISLSIYPINSMVRAVVLLLRRNKWSNIASMTDSNSVTWEPFHRGLVDGFVDAFSRKDSSYGIRYNAFHCNASTDSAEIVSTLRAISEISRSKRALLNLPYYLFQNNNGLMQRRRSDYTINT